MKKTKGKRRGAKKGHKKGAKLSEKQKSEVYKMVNKDVEKKFFDSFSTIAQQYGTPATGSLTADLTNITQNVGGNQRIGDQIVPHYVESRFTFENQATNPNSTTRVIYFQWRVDNTVAPTAADILDVGPGGAVVNSWSPYNYDKRHLFTIIKDFMFDMNGNIGSSKYTRCFSFKIPLIRKTARVNYNAGANTGDHHIYLFIIGSNANSATGQLVTVDTRLIYSDQ